jgi:hypothetical protein
MRIVGSGANHHCLPGEISLPTYGIDPGLTNNDSGATLQIETEQDEEIVLQIQPLPAGSPVAGPWKSGPTSRNPDGAVHALVTTIEGPHCLLVVFEDEDAADWGDHPDEPNYSDTLLWVYPTVSPPYDTAECPREAVGIRDE